MFVAKCGGIKLNEDIFKEINGVITLSTESEVHDPVTSCGQLWDSNIFSVGKVEDRYIISMATRHEEIPLGSLIKANCSILCDGHYFSVDEKGVLSFTERYLLEVLVSDIHGNAIPGCEITVTKEEEQIEPFAETDNIFPLDEIDGEYVVNVSAPDYVAQEINVTANEDQILTVTLAQE